MSSITRFAAVLAAALAALVSAASSPAATATTFSGRATVVSGTVLGTIPITLADTGEVGSSGGNLETTVVCYPNGPNCTLGAPDLTSGAVGAKVLHATVVAHGNKSSAEASTADFTLNAGGQSVGADFLMARATASCANGTASVSGSSDVARLVVNGTVIDVSGAANQVVPVGTLGTVTVNEQVPFSTPDSGITVNALHISIPGVADLVVGQATADIACGSAAGGCDDGAFVTGGGWILDAQGQKAHFAVAGRNLQPWGHVLYKPGDVHVKDPYSVAFYGPGTLGSVLDDLAGRQEFAQALSDLTPLGRDTTLDGGAILAWDVSDPLGTHRVGEVLVLDLGEPGNLPKGHDYFEIAGVGGNTIADAAAGFLQGGNIQMHRC